MYRLDQTLEPIVVLRLFFLAAAALIIIIYLLPVLRNRFLAYGSRSHNELHSRPSQAPNTFVRFLNNVAALQVPHGYFLHFYILSVCSSLVWAHQLWAGGTLYDLMSGQGVQHENNIDIDLLSLRDQVRSRHYSKQHVNSHAMSIEQVGVVWTLLFIQGSRRLFESVMFARGSNSKMWVGHWLLGLLFYMSIGVAVWIEGVPALDSANRPFEGFHIDTLVGPGEILAKLPTPSVRFLVFAPVFLIASGLQHDVHQYLHSLPKPKTPKTTYTRPTHPLFSMTVTPHYFFEILIYLSLAVLSAPGGQYLNLTVTCGLVFVAVNLGVTAIGTREFWVRTWGPESIIGKARMIPGIW